MYIEKLASQIKNDILSGLKGYHQNLSINIKQLEDEVVATRLSLLQTAISSGIVPIKDLLTAINCVEVNCESIERCRCIESDCDTKVRHIEIPQVINDLGDNAIDYIGTVDRMTKFNLITSFSQLQMHKYKKRGSNKPYVWIDFAPNNNGMLDCFLFNCPFIELVSVVGIFKDPRQVERYGCCTGTEYDLTGVDDNVSYIGQMVKDTLVENKIKLYRGTDNVHNRPNTQEYSTGD